MAMPAGAGSTRSEPAGKIQTSSCQAGEITRRVREQEGLASAGQTSSPRGLVHSPLPSGERQHRLAPALISPSGLVWAGVSPPRAAPLLRKHSPHLSERCNAALQPRRTGSGSGVQITHGHLPREGMITAPAERHSVAECSIKHQHTMGQGRARWGRMQQGLALLQCHSHQGWKLPEPLEAGPPTVILVCLSYSRSQSETRPQAAGGCGREDKATRKRLGGFVLRALGPSPSCSWPGRCW